MSTVTGTAGDDVIGLVFASVGVVTIPFPFPPAPPFGASPFPDVIFGLGGNDSIAASDGGDSIDAGSGNDTIDPGFGPDTVTGGLGTDLVTYGSAPIPILADLLAGFAAAGPPFDTGILIGIENIITGFGDDTIFGSLLDNSIGGAADDAFTFIGTLVFSAGGQLRVQNNGTDTIIQGNTDADLTTSELLIRVEDGAILPTAWDASDFIL